MAKPPKHKRLSVIKETLAEKRTVEIYDGNFCCSFAHFDHNQEPASSFYDWEAEGHLAQAIDVLKGYCSSGSLESQLRTDKFTYYGTFPENSLFTHPKHVPEDALWARIHVGGKLILAGHIVGNTFFIVFFDSEHKFCLMSN